MTQTKRRNKAAHFKDVLSELPRSFTAAPVEQERAVTPAIWPAPAPQKNSAAQRPSRDTPKKKRRYNPARGYTITTDGFEAMSYGDLSNESCSLNFTQDGLIAMHEKRVKP